MTRTLAKLSIALVLTTAITACSSPARRAHRGGLTHASHHLVNAVLDHLAQRPVPATPQPAAIAKRIKPAPVPAPVVDKQAQLVVKRLVVTHGVASREPLAAGKVFVAGRHQRIYAFVEVGNPQRANSKVYVSFVPPNGSERSGVSLRVGRAHRWRTWAYTRLATKPGVWRVVVRDASGKRLATTTFEVTTSLNQS